MMPSEHPAKEAFRASIRHAIGPSQIIEWEDGLLLVDQKGKISACDSYENLKSRLPQNCVVHDWRGSWIVPGFIDCHVHLPQLDCRNKNGLTLLDWLKTYIFPVEAQFENPKIAEKIAPRFFDELLSHGITTAAIYSTVHYEATRVAFEVANDKGIRAIIGQALMDQNAPSALLKPAKQLLAESEKLLLEWHGKNNRLYYAFTPRFALTCSRELIRNAGKLASEAGAYFQTHLAETTQEVKEAKALHDFKNYAAFYEKNHCLSSKSILAHCIYLNDEEWKVIASNNGAIAHCPTSNVFLKSGTMPLDKVEEYNLRYGLGTDVGAGPTFSMEEIIHCACEVHPKEKMNEKKGFYLATYGGAKALSLGEQIGNFEPGKWADFSVFSNSSLKGLAKKVYVAGASVWEASKGS